MMRVVWQTEVPTSQSLVEYGSSNQFGNSALATRRTYPYETGAIVEATLYNLKPNSTYYYRVGNAADGWSKTSQFRTADPNPKEFSFTAFGDHGISEDAVKNVENTLFENPAFKMSENFLVRISSSLQRFNLFIFCKLTNPARMPMGLPLKVPAW